MSAQDWPTKPLGIVVPFAPGGSADVFGRTVAQHRQFSKLIGRPTMSLSAVVASAPA